MSFNHDDILVHVNWTFALNQHVYNDQFFVMKTVLFFFGIMKVKNAHLGNNVKSAELNLVSHNKIYNIHTMQGKLTGILHTSSSFLRHDIHVYAYFCTFAFSVGICLTSLLCMLYNKAITEKFFG